MLGKELENRYLVAADAGKVGVNAEAVLRYTLKRAKPSKNSMGTTRGLMQTLPSVKCKDNSSTCTKFMCRSYSIKILAIMISTQKLSQRIGSPPMLPFSVKATRRLSSAH
jgi:hypothetical protein